MAVRRRQTKGRSERLEARCTPEQKEIFQHAAALAGQTLSDFMLASLEEAAARRIEQREVMLLTIRDAQAVIDALRNPSEPTPAMRRAADRHRAWFGD